MATNPEIVSNAALEPEALRLVKAHKVTVTEGVAISVATSLKRIADMFESQMPKRDSIKDTDDGT